MLISDITKREGAWLCILWHKLFWTSETSNKDVTSLFFEPCYWSLGETSKQASNGGRSARRL